MPYLRQLLAGRSKPSAGNRGALERHLLGLFVSRMQRSNIVKLKIPSLVLALLLLWAIAAKAPTGVTPAFFGRRDYPNFPTNWINVFDANGDGIPDIVGTASSTHVLLGNGDGTFRPGPTSP